MSDLNDPRVYFAAERTLLAWNRTALSLMAFGFMVERFGLSRRQILKRTAGSRAATEKHPNSLAIPLLATH